MPRTMLLKSVLALVVLAVAVTVGQGDPPTVVDPEVAGYLGTGQGFPLAPDPPTVPRIASYANSGCLDDTDDPRSTLCADDEIELVVEGGTLHMLHRNATYNCCFQDLVVSLTVEDDLVILTEEEIFPQCFCICCYEIEATVVDLVPGTYTVGVCWYDYEADQMLCHWEEITIGRGGGDPPRSDPPLLSDPNDIAHTDASGVPPVEIDPVGPPYVEDYANSGCLRDTADDPQSRSCGDDEVELTVDGTSLHVLHENATYNCCLNDIVITLVVEGNRLILTEEEILTIPCLCLCCYDVEATVVDLVPGTTYTVEFCWFDRETWDVLCHIEDIVVPRN